MIDTFKMYCIKIHRNKFFTQSLSCSFFNRPVKYFIPSVCLKNGDVVFFLAIEGFGRVPLVAEQFFNGLQDFGIVTIPMFLLMGIAVAASPAGKDLYSALDRWLNKVPGGLVLSNLGACSIFAALCGSSPATCAAIGKMGIPEMRKRGYSAELASGTICAGGTLGILIPPSITMIIYGISTGTSIGKLFIAGIIPGIMLTALFMGWAYIYARINREGSEKVEVCPACPVCPACSTLISDP